MVPDGTRNQDRLFCRGPAAIYPNNRVFKGFNGIDEYMYHVLERSDVRFCS
jgi:hypothetical protein